MKLTVSLLLLGSLLGGPARAETPSEYVVVLHGMGRTRHSMAMMAGHLRREGYGVICETYPGRRLPVERLASEWLAPLVRERVPAGARVHFVTHSLGGILVRHYLSATTPPNLGRVVMLAPPNQGSELSDFMGRWTLPRLWTGPALAQLGTGPDSAPNRLGPIAAECGVIAGNRSLNPLFSCLFDGPNDGKVSVARTRLAGMKEHLEVPYSHTWLMNRAYCREKVARFLREGTFE